jgi:hypothetical protein
MNTSAQGLTVCVSLFFTVKQQSQPSLSLAVSMSAHLHAYDAAQGARGECAIQARTYTRFAISVIDDIEPQPKLPSLVVVVH